MGAPAGIAAAHSCARRARSATNVTRRSSSPPSWPTSASRRRCGTSARSVPGSSPPLIDYTRRPNVTALRRGTRRRALADVQRPHRRRAGRRRAQLVLRPVGRGDRRRAHVRARRRRHEGGRRGDARRAARAARRRDCAGDICVETVIEEECTGNGAAACRARGPRTDAAMIPEPFNHAALEAQVGVLWATVHRRGQGRARRTRRPGRQRVHQGAAGDRGDPRVGARGQRGVGAAPELQRRRRAGRRLGVVGAGGMRPRSAPGGAAGRGPGGGQGALRGRGRERPRRVARVPRRTASSSRATSRSSTCSAARTGGPRRPAWSSWPSPARPTRAPSSSTTSTPATCYGPIGGNLHAPDEWVDLASVFSTTLVLASFAAEWCA